MTQDTEDSIAEDDTTFPSKTTSGWHRSNPELPHKCMKDFDRELILEVLNIYNKLNYCI